MTLSANAELLRFGLKNIRGKQPRLIDRGISQ